MSTVSTSTRVHTLPKKRKRKRMSLLGLIACGVLVLFLLIAIFGPLIAPYDPNELNVGPQLQPPNSEYLFGTDALGRDQLSRVLAAIRPAIIAAVSATAIAFVFGSILGMIAGYVGGRVDNLISRFVDFLFAIPEYLLALLVLAILGSGLLNAALAIGIVFTPRFARTVRGSTLEIMSRNYISAARLSGRSRGWIMLRHVLPNVASPLIVLAALNLSMSGGAYASLSFLGFGVRPPNADIGSMLSGALQYIGSDAWLVAPPVLAFVILTLAINLAGDALRDRLDPSSSSASTK